MGKKTVNAHNGEENEPAMPDYPDLDTPETADYTGGLYEDDKPEPGLVPAPPEQPDLQTEMSDAIADAYPMFNDSRLRRRALRHFLERGSIEEAARHLHVPYKTVVEWAYQGKWVDSLKRENAVLRELNLIEVETLRLRERVPRIRKQLETGDELRDKAMDDMRKGDLNTRSAAEVYKMVADTEHRLLGLRDTGGVGTADTTNEDGQNQSGKTPLVVVFGNGELPPIRTNRD